MISTFLTLTLGMSEKFSFSILNKTKYLQNQFISISYILLSFISLILAFLVYQNIDFSFFNSSTIYISIILEIISYKLAKYNYKTQKDYTEIAFAQMSSIWIIFLIAIVLDPILNYKENILKTTSTETLIISLTFFLMTVTYFYDKIKIKNINKSLILYSLTLPLTMYFAVKNMQHFQSLTIYSVIIFSIGSIHLIETLILKKERRKYKKLLKKQYQIGNLNYLGISFITFSLNLIAMIFLSVQFFTLFKRIGQLIAAITIDKIIYKKEPSKKDVVIIVLIFIIGIFVFYKNQ